LTPHLLPSDGGLSAGPEEVCVAWRAEVGGECACV
jgi:hypothetical protein